MTDRRQSAAAVLVTPVHRRELAAVAIGAGLAFATSVRGVDARRRPRRSGVTAATTTTGTNGTGTSGTAGTNATGVSETGTDATFVTTGTTNTGTSQTNGNLAGENVVRTVRGEVVTGAPRADG